MPNILTKEDEVKLLQQLKTRAEQLAAFNPDELQRLNLGELNFAAGERLFKNIQSFFAECKDKSWEGVPPQTLTEFENPMRVLVESLSRIISFSIRGMSSPQEEIRNHLENTAVRWKQAYDTILPHLAFQMNKDTGIAKARTEMQNQWSMAITTASQKLSEKERSIDKALSEANQALEAIQKAAKEVGITQEAIHFNELAKDYCMRSKLWMAAAGAFAAATLVYIFFGKAIEIKPSEHVANIVAIFPRLVVLSTLFTGLVFCLRNYSALRHNEVVNRQRQTALTTFQTFVSGTSDPDTKNAVLLQATKAIFSPQASGYLKGEGEMPAVNQVTEVVRSITSPKT
jgi:hypothetical protein